MIKAKENINFRFCFNLNFTKISQLDDSKTLNSVAEEVANT
jgi:hypothetical protein